MVWSRNDMGNKLYQFSRLKTGETFRTMGLFSFLTASGRWTGHNVQENGVLCLLCPAARCEKTLSSKLSKSFLSSVSIALQPHTQPHQCCQSWLQCPALQSTSTLRGLQCNTTTNSRKDNLKKINKRKKLPLSIR